MFATAFCIFFALFFTFVAFVAWLTDWKRPDYNNVAVPVAFMFLILATVFALMSKYV